MSDIVKIVIRGESKFENAREIYKDRMVLEGGIASYEYHPLFKTARNPMRKWANEAASPEAMNKILEIIPRILEISGMERRPDAASMEFEVHYEDGTKQKKQLWPVGEDLSEVKDLLEQMVPTGEELPEMLKREAEEDW